jgi:hypothetical protein
MNVTSGQRLKGDQEVITPGRRDGLKPARPYMVSQGWGRAGCGLGKGLRGIISSRLAVR